MFSTAVVTPSGHPWIDRPIGRSNGAQRAAGILDKLRRSTNKGPKEKEYRRRNLLKRTLTWAMMSRNSQNRLFNWNHGDKEMRIILAAGVDDMLSLVYRVRVPIRVILFKVGIDVTALHNDAQRLPSFKQGA